MQQIYKRAPMKSDFRNHTSALVFSCKFAGDSQNTFSNTSGGQLLKIRRKCCLVFKKELLSKILQYLQKSASNGVLYLLKLQTWTCNLRIGLYGMFFLVDFAKIFKINVLQNKRRRLRLDTHRSYETRFVNIIPVNIY